MVCPPILTIVIYTFFESFGSEEFGEMRGTKGYGVRPAIL
jgi:hypothetical protein